jgi:hypothetical protein
MNPDPKKKAIRLSPSERAKLKKDLYYGRARKRWETCNKSLPWSVEGVWDKFTCAHLSHIKSRGSGGDDSPENTKIECWDCHSGKHGPRWSEQ